MEGGVMTQVKATVNLQIDVNLRTDIPSTEFIISVSTDSRTKSVLLRNANILIRTKRPTGSSRSINPLGGERKYDFFFHDKVLQGQGEIPKHNLTNK